jgi:hypothetical protein
MNAWWCRGCWFAGLIAVAGCAASHQRESRALPANESLVREQLIIHSDFKLPKRHRLVDELVALRTDVADKLQLPVSDEPIHVYLFEDGERYREFVAQHFTNLGERRAFFVESDTRLAVHAHWGDRVAEDLRHEVTHGYLHAVVHNLPLWLDEGLAEYFEVSRGNHGVNRPHVQLLTERLQRRQWRPDLARLHGLSRLEDMKQLDYAEAWLWTHFLLESSELRLTLVQNYLARLRMKGESAPLMKYLAEAEPDVHAELVKHLLAFDDAQPDFE